MDEVTFAHVSAQASSNKTPLASKSPVSIQKGDVVISRQNSKNLSDFIDYPAVPDKASIFWKIKLQDERLATKSLGKLIDKEYSVGK